MLEEFKDSQPLFYDEIQKSIIKNKKLSHAYLIETNSFPKSRELVFAFVKILLCESANETNHKSFDCNICHLIDENSFSDLIMIEPDGMWIKKEQLKKLQESFKTKSLNGGKRIYIIFNAEKLNKSSANTILKFLEEPEEDIVAILVTNNRYQVLNTILSRCQILSLTNKQSNFVTEQEDFSLYLSFLEDIYQNGANVLVEHSNIFNSYMKSRDDCNNFLNNLKSIYVDILEKQSNREYLTKKYGQAILTIVDKKDINDIINKLKVIQTYQERLKLNVNIKLWIDSFIINLSGGESACTK